MRRWAITLCTTDRLWSDRPTIGGDSSAVSDLCVTWSTTFSMAQARPGDHPSQDHGVLGPGCLGAVNRSTVTGSVTRLASARVLWHAFG
jgi:hypothetical protein